MYHKHLPTHRAPKTMDMGSGLSTIVRGKILAKWSWGRPNQRQIVIPNSAKHIHSHWMAGLAWSQLPTPFPPQKRICVSTIKGISTKMLVLREWVCMGSLKSAWRLSVSTSKNSWNDGRVAWTTTCGWSGLQKLHLKCQGVLLDVHVVSRSRKRLYSTRTQLAKKWADHSPNTQEGQLSQLCSLSETKTSSWDGKC